MARTRERVVPPEDETRDRRAVERWMGQRTLEDVGADLRRNRQFMSRWFRHEAEITDMEIDHWHTVTGVARGTLMEGRIESRQLAERIAQDSAA